ncbi:hypothetical protein ACIBFB_21260 [Nocardiopsis sp. NPDC050513]|uniref:hypothetical protein n=1 Tax=Nocardiopsis sp. NPDC050513 TaxID=3364338 RepID=UPI00379A94A4
MVPIRLLAAAALLAMTGCGPFPAGDGDPDAGPRGASPAATSPDSGRAPAPRRVREPAAEPGPAPDPSPAAENRTRGAGSAPGSPPSAGAWAGARAGARAWAGQPPAADAYVAALAGSSDPDRMRGGLEEAAEDSPAYTYLLHHTAVARAWADGGRGLTDPQVDRTDTGYRVCRDVAQEGYGGGDRDADRRCVELTDFAFDDGRVARFRVDGADPSCALVEGGRARVRSGGVEASVVSAYRPVGQTVLVVTLDIAAAAGADVGLPGAVYRTSDGEYRRADRAVGRYELDAGDSTSAALYFPDSHPGGTVLVGGCLEECSAVVKLALPVS